MTVHDLSFDPADPYVDLPGSDGLRVAVQVFTTVNGYGLDPARLTTTGGPDALTVRCDGLQRLGGQRPEPGVVELRARREAGAWAITVRAEHEEPVKAVKLLVQGLPPEALAGGWWTATTPAGERQVADYQTPVRLTYPDAKTWLTPWACAGADGTAFTVAVRQDAVRAARLYAHRPPWAGGDTVVEVVCDEDASVLDGTFTTPQVRLRPCDGPGEVDADFIAHTAHITAVHALTPWEQRADVPSWAREVRLVVNLHGQHWTGHVFNTYDVMADALRFVTEHIPGPQVLAYLPGWEGRYYWRYPWFAPAEEMGGEAGFRRLVGTARELQVHLMPMFGAHGANAQLYPQWEEAAFRNTTDRYTVLFNKPDWDGDRQGEDDQVFLNTGNAEFRKALVEQVVAMVEEHDLPAVYFDTTAAWFNDPRANLVEGYRALVEELHARFPDLLVAGEGWTDALLGLFPVCLAWLPPTVPVHRPELLATYGRAVQHLLEGAPGAGSTGVYEGGYTPALRRPMTPGHLPSVSIVEDTLKDHAEEVAALCRDARA